MGNIRGDLPQGGDRGLLRGGHLVHFAPDAHQIVRPARACLHPCAQITGGHGIERVRDNLNMAFGATGEDQTARKGNQNRWQQAYQKNVNKKITKGENLGAAARDGQKTAV